jgi:Vps52 / Sac2 family
MLDKIEGVVDNFQGHIHEVSRHVQTLQTKSQSINVSLNNRRELEDKVHVYLQAVILPEDLIKSLSFGEIDNPEYLKKVEILNQKLVKLRSSEVGDSKAL